MSLNQLLSELNIKHNMTAFVLSERTYHDQTTLYYKNIPSALLYLNHLSMFQTPLQDDKLKVKGTMIDLSRNAVFRVDYFKAVIKKQALLGYNEIWLYLEDIYELKNYPKFGYLRGKYSKEELIELVTYAAHFGVRLVPCIQTLGHMSQFLRWPSSEAYKDQRDVLLISDQTYQLIDEMLLFCKEVFQTNKIHVGLDETFGFSFGTHYKLHGYQSPESLFLNHVSVVYEKAKAVGFDEICMWSDMFFRHRSKTNYYYDYSISFEEDFINQLPKEMTLVYWDYYNKNYEVYDQMIKKHKEMNRKVIMASGTWIWTRLTYDQKKTLETASHAIRACINNQLDEIILTQWNDDGAYAVYDSSFLGLSDINKLLSNSKFNETYLDKNHILNTKAQTMLSLVSHQGFDPVMLLWDDVLLGIYLNDLVGYDFNKIQSLISTFRAYQLKASSDINSYYQSLFLVLLKKLELREALLRGYFKDHHFFGIETIATDLKRQLMAFLEGFERMWKQTYKVFGLEVIQSRLYSQLRRVDELITVTTQFKKGDSIPYLDENLSKEPYLSVKYADIAFSSKP
ncbi:Glycoside hydrolase, family 20 [Paracholeplasma brassicae]|uniref:Glycoside hydrolase, family 20 n=1 Tax=Acholeplasma brassicae TaxID=61635 RepID=U4KMQ4_9MOLU|nr:beta-N-acetylhexosaminidase [Paracholeplasma brassicae]CCV65430.1 Glycoside hydrolase, family 20 [Paracholeplasma brassicae]